LAEKCNKIRTFYEVIIFHLQELRNPKFLQFDSTALINEAFGLNTTSACVDQHTHEEVEKLQNHVETLEAQVS
jgi:hypothetical protein